MTIKLRIGLIAALTLFALMSAAKANTELRVVATIKPLHSLVAGVMDGVATPYLIVKGAATPHAYALKPSDATAIQQAQVVFRIGGALERFLDTAISSSASAAITVSMIENANLRRLPYREGEQWGNADHAGHGHGNHSHSDHGHDRKPAEQITAGPQSNIDPHIWLSPENAIAIVDIIAVTLMKADPSQAETFARNASDLSGRLRQLEAEIRAKTASLRLKPFLVFHDAYQYFEDAFNVEAAGAISLGDTRAPGVKRIRALQRELKNRRIACVFAEPQFEPRLINAVIATTDVRRGTLDPIGADIEEGPEAYFTLIRRNAAALVKCLNPG